MGRFQKYLDAVAKEASYTLSLEVEWLCSLLGLQFCPDTLGTDRQELLYVVDQLLTIGFVPSFGLLGSIVRS